MGASLILLLILLFIIWKGRMVLVSLGFKECPKITEMIITSWFARLFFNRNDKNTVVKYLYNQHMIKLYSENTYLYYIPDNKKMEILDEYKARFGLA